MRPQKIRPYSEFVEQEIKVPQGEYAGQRFRIARQPFTRFIFDAYDSGFYNTFVLTGMRQSGKTLVGSTIPVLYHLFEMGENVIYAIPDMEMVTNKWQEDLLPAIMATRYRDLLPRKGAGSKGGRVRSIKFLNGATLRFMTGGGSDKSRVGFTSRVVVITELEGLAVSMEKSTEADKITQILYCTQSYGERRRVYMECTLTTRQGRTFKEIQTATASRLVMMCRHCEEFVQPEREHFVGWQEAEDVVTAKESAAFGCPNCGSLWTEADRQFSIKTMQIVHKGQEILKNGTIEGPHPRTHSFGLRWGPAHNALLKTSDFAEREWTASRDPDEDNSEREVCQFLWAIPYEPKELDVSVINENAASKRVCGTPKGVIPLNTEWVTCFCDIGKYKCWWITVAWKPDFQGVIIDYDFISVKSNEMEEELAVLRAMAEFYDIVSTGWIREKANDMLLPHQVWIDCRHLPRAIHKFCREANTKQGAARFRPAEGFGQAMSEARKRPYYRPKSSNKVTVFVGDEFHIDFEATAGLHVCKVNADYWTKRVIRGLTIPDGTPGAITFYRGGKNEHRTAIKHFMSTRVELAFIPGKGMQETLVQTSRNNHLLDCLYNCAAEASLCGARLEPPKPVQHNPEEQPKKRLTTPDGRPYLVTER